MWSDNDPIFLGLILVGFGLTIRVVVEGSREANTLKQKLEHFRLATESCRAKGEEVLAKVQTMAGEVAELQEEFQAVEGRKGNLDKKVRAMKQRVEK